jgi:O-antigen ligase
MIATIGSPAHRTQAEVLKEPLKGAYWGLLAFFVVYCGEPGFWIPGLSHLHPARVAGGIALVAFVLSIGQVRRGFSKESILIILLLGQLVLASMFSPVWKGGAFQTTLGFAQMVLIFLVIPMAVNSLARIRRLIFVETASVAVIAAISIRESHMSAAGRMKGLFNGIYSNPNDLAIAIVLALPFAIVFFVNAKGYARKLVWGATAPLMIYAVLRTGSRGGLIALALVGISVLWSFAVKGKRSYLVVLALAAFAVLFAFAGHDVIDRFQSTFSEKQGNEAAYESAQTRRQLLIKSVVVTSEHPLFGIGPGNFPIVSGVWDETHNVYTELSSECGLPALILFLMVYWDSFKNVREARKRAGRQTELGMLADASQAGLLAFAITAVFYPDAYQYFLYFLFAYATVMRRIAFEAAPIQEQRLAARHPNAPFSMTGSPVAASTPRAVDGSHAENRGSPTVLKPMPVNLRR